jgi:uncharacterized membrane protein
MSGLLQVLSNYAVRFAKYFDFYRFKDIVFLEKVFLYFWFGSLVGQLYEIVAWNHNSDTLIPFAPPYGLGMIAVIIFISPIIKRQSTSLFKSFFLITLTMAIVEYLCAAAIILVHGENIYWNYSNRVLNFGGDICAESALLFGLMATIFLYYIYPLTERLFAKQQKKITDILFGATFFFFVFDLFYSVIL